MAASATSEATATPANAATAKARRVHLAFAEVNPVPHDATATAKPTNKAAITP